MTKLDGNALAGAFAEVFARDVTTAVGVCSPCENPSPIGSIAVYVGGPASVLRCPMCGADWGYLGRYPDGLRLSLTGVDSITFPAAGSPR